MSFAQAAGAPGFAALVARLSETSADFRRMWPEHDVSDLGEGVRRFSSTRHGKELLFRHHLLMPDAFPDLRITIYIPIETA